MRKIAFIVVVSAVSGLGQITVVAKNACAGSWTANGGASTSVDSRGGTGAALFISSYSGGGLVAFSDGLNTWVADTPQTADPRGQWFHVASGFVASATHVITITAASSYAVGCLYIMAGSAAFDVQNGAHGSAVNSIQPGSVSPSQDGEIIFEGLSGAGLSVAISSGFSTPDTDAPAGLESAAASYKIQTTAGAENPTWSWPGSTGNSSALAITFRAASTGPPLVTGSVSGNWSSTTTWGGHAAPGNGDVVGINTGVTVTVDTNATFGHFPSGGCGSTTALQITGTGRLDIATGITLHQRGCAVLAGSAQLTAAADSVYEWDASAAASPSSTHYTTQIGAANNDNAKVTLAGTCTGGTWHPAAVQANAGGGSGSFTNGGLLRGGMISGGCVKGQNIGAASTDAIQFYPSNSADVFSLNHFICDSCGRIFQTGIPDDNANIHITNSSWTNSVGTVNVYLAGWATHTPGTFTVLGDVFDQSLEAFPPRGIQFSNNYLGNGWVMGTGPWLSFTNNFSESNGPFVPEGDVTDYYASSIEPTNPHFLSHQEALNVTIDGMITDYLGTAFDGDSILVSTSAGVGNLTVQNSIKLPNAGGSSSGTCLTLGGNSTLTVTFVKNTCFIGADANGAGIFSGHDYIGYAGMVRSFKDNAFWDTTARGWKIYCDNTPIDCMSPVTDVVSAANADYNGGLSSEFLAGRSGRGYDTVFTGTPGAHDLNADPGFSDSSRNQAKWDLSLGGPGTAAHAQAGMKARNTATWDSRYAIAELIDWVRQGFAPQYLPYATAGHDGGRIGAVQPITIMGAALAQ